MATGKYNHIKQRTKFCPKGHDKDIEGRNQNGACKKCISESRKKLYIPHPKVKTKFCPKGHDKDVVGRLKNGACKECAKLRQRKDPSKNSRVHQFCPKGHDTFIVGRIKDSGQCKECRKIYMKNKLQRIKNGLYIMLPEKLFCINGHDISVVGRTKWGICNGCQKEKHPLAVGCPKGTKQEPRQFCANGHDISTVGRNANGHCIPCKKEYDKQYRVENLEKLLEYKRQYRKEHPEILRALAIKSQTNRNLRIPIWTDWEKINEFERNRPEGMTTDHYIPLQGDFVSGLHVSWNLQYLTRSENSRKKNKCNLLEVSEWYGEILEKAGLK